MKLRLLKQIVAIWIFPYNLSAQHKILGLLSFRVCSNGRFRLLSVDTWECESRFLVFLVSRSLSLSLSLFCLSEPYDDVIKFRLSSSEKKVKMVKKNYYKMNICESYEICGNSDVGGHKSGLKLMNSQAVLTNFYRISDFDQFLIDFHLIFW